MKNCWRVLSQTAESLKWFPLRGPQNLFSIREMKHGNGTIRPLLWKLQVPLTPHHHHNGVGCRSPCSNTNQNCPPSTALGQFQYLKNARAPGFHDVQCNRNHLAWKFFKAGVASHPPQPQKSFKNTPKLHLTQSMGILSLPRGLAGVSHKTHSQLTAWNYVTGLLTFGACQPKKQSFPSSMGNTELFLLALVRYQNVVK